MNKTRILIDLSTALHKTFCGMATENRLMFKMLASLDNLSADGLLLSSAWSTVFSRYQQSVDESTQLRQAQQFFHEALGHEPHLLGQCLQRLRLGPLFVLLQRQFKLYPIAPVFQEMIWRSMFAQTLNSEDRAWVEKQAYCFSKMTTHHIRAGAYFKKPVHLNTSSYRAVLFSEPVAVKVSPQTKKIVRFHDVIPMTDPDFVGTRYASGKWNTLDLCAEDSWFVCNSEPTREALLQIKPALEKSSWVIPCAIDNRYQRVQDISRLKKIIQTRLAFDAWPHEWLKAGADSLEQLEQMDYIFHLATLDPKKNQLNLIRAFEHYQYRYGEKRPLKLIIAGHVGPFSETVIDAMRPHVINGQIIHLTKVSAEEMPYLFSHAKAFVFPSYTEGFGLPPLEAMQCECPTIISDIKTHRAVMGDAPLYANPYDSSSLADCLYQLLLSDEANAQRQQCIERGLKQVDQYSVKKNSLQWSQFLNHLQIDGT